MTEEQKVQVAGLVSKIMKYNPEWKGPTQPKDAVSDVLKVIEDARLANGLAGAFISHLGNKQWV